LAQKKILQLMLTGWKNSRRNMMQSLGRQYVRYFNYTYRRTGTLWEGRFKSCVVDADNYLLICQRYIGLNPVRANMGNSPEEYRWSSYRTNGQGYQTKLCTPHELYQRPGKTVKQRTQAYKDLFISHLDDEVISEIRNASNKGMALGDDKFRLEVEESTGRRVTELKRGPKTKKL